MRITNNSSSYFTDKIAAFDFDQFSNSTKRILLHIVMWSSFSILLFLSYRLAYEVTRFNSFLLTLRMTVVNAIVFYLFFYSIAPIIISGTRIKSILLLLLSFPICIFIWISLTYILSLIYHHLGIEIENGELKGAIEMAASQSFLQAVSLKRMLSQSIIIISLLSPFFFAKILYEISKLYSKNLKTQGQKTKLEIQNINIERDFLKSQLNPHFLFNTLNNLYSLTLKKDDLAPEVILNLSDIMSYTLYESNSERVSLEKELEFVKNYFELEKMRYPSEKNIQIRITNDGSMTNLYIAPLLTFTFIENAFKHGLNNTYNQFVKMNIFIQNKVFYFQLENDTCQVAQSNTLGGIGLENIKKRLELLYPNHYNLRTKKEAHKFTVLLKIDLDSQ